MKITSVCIDDFALKKRKRYGTVMIEQKTHKIVDMIDSREYAEVKQWLQSYPNLRMVSRDGSITYHNAITDAHPNAIQISDRFHLLKNLTSYGQEYLKKELKQKISIPISEDFATESLPPVTLSAANRKLTLREKYEQARQLEARGYAKTRICKCLNMDIRAYEKLLSTPPDLLEMRFQSTQMSVHEERLQRKMELVSEVRELWQNAFSKREISRRTGLAYKTVDNYLGDNFNGVHAAYGKKGGGALTPYEDEINRMAEQGIMGSAILKELQEKGYTGSPSNLRHYLSDLKKQQKHAYRQEGSAGEPTQLLDRKNVFQLLYHPIEKVKSISQPQFDALCVSYSCFEKIFSIIWSFKTLLTTKDSSLLEPWMIRAKSLGIREIDSFIEGIKRDLEAVKHAIALPESNGLAEGSVNKLKVIKRIMYGRCSFDTLRSKTLSLESLRCIN